MKKIVTAFVISLWGFANYAVAQVSNNNEDGVYKTDCHVKGNACVDGEVIVKFRESSSVRKMSKGQFKISAISTVDKVFAELGVEEVEQLMPLSGELKMNAPRRLKAYNGKEVELRDMSTLYTIRFNKKQHDIHSVIARLNTLDAVEFAEPNYLLNIVSTGDGDNYKKDPLEKNQWERTAINIYNLWNTPKITTKRPVIAILDTGVDITHPDLADNIWTNKLENDGAEGTDDDANGFKDDIHGWDFVNNTGRIRDNNGHGTHCAGIAAAVGGNGIGLAGANPDAYIMPITVMQSDGTGDVATIIKGIDYATANGADVISMSLGGYSQSIAEEQALAHAYATAILVAAAGNDGHTLEYSGHCLSCGKGGTPMFPAAYTFVLGVQSSHSGVGLASFSNWDNNGPFFSTYGEEQLYNYELTAPGVNIVSTFPGGKYKALNGTSMACPLVAGAISRLMQCKELSSKEELFGDLINSTTAAGNLDIYKAYQMSDANRKPTLTLITYNLDDTAGDGDGRPDAGETIDIYPVIRNSWGTAQNIRVSIELAETEDPEMVQIINGTADFGYNLSSYGKATSVNPLRIKINDECADGRHLCMVIKATCDNITTTAEQDVVLKAENGVEIGGVLTEDMTLKEGVNYIVTSNFAIPKGVTLTIEPGAAIKLKSGISLVNSGTVICEGTPEKMIRFYANNATIQRLYLNTTCKYTIFEDISGTYGMFSATLENCVVRNSESAYLSNSNASRTNIYNNTALYGVFISTLENCNYVGNNLTSWDEYDFYLYGINPSNLNGSNCFGNYSSHFKRDINIAYYTSSFSSVKMSPCYLGSSVYENFSKGIFDMTSANSTSLGVIDYSNYLSKPSSEAHGIVWKVVVNGKDAQDEFEELAPLGVGKHKFEVYFNRPMNKSVAPIISMGVREPYTSVSVAEEGENSGWNEAGDIYTAYLTINGKTNADGLNRIRVYGAEDDEYFEIPEEKYRFNVMVQKAGSMSTGLMATEGLGKVTLNWETAEEDFSDLMGYNVYRYTEREETYNEWGYNENNEYGYWEKIRTVRDTSMVNQTLIDATETELIDYDVVPGTTYYYYIKEMGTDLQQHDVSNVVAATPLTAQKGDANGSMTVDVADVVTEVNYLTGQNPQPFIFEAADVNEDETVNILDIVGTVNIIMAPAGASTASVDNTAVFNVEDGILYVDATTPLGGVQVSVNAAAGTELEVLSGLNGMEYAGSWMSDNEYMLLAYSMSGRTIGIGKQPLLRIGDAEVKNLVASDAQGHNVLAINDSATSIENVPFGIEDFAGADVRYFDLSGRQIVRPLKNQNGLYIQGIYLNGKCVKSYKIMQ